MQFDTVGGGLPAPSAPLLERGTELAALEGVLAGAVDGRSGLVLVEGDAGLGKSSLLSTVRELARTRGFTVLNGRGGVMEQTFGWGVARQLFEGTVARAPSADRKVLLRGSAALAMRALGIDDPADGHDRPHEDFHVEHGLYWLACNLSERGPLALLIDDLHWCDDATLEWLLYLARRAEDLSLAVIVTVRTGEPGTPRRLLDLLADEPIARRLELAPLGPEATGVLLRDAFEADVELEFEQACHAWTGGNPLFVSELAGELVAEGIAPIRSAVDGIRMLTPAGASRVVLLRLARLSPDAVRLAQAAAVLDSHVGLRYGAALVELEPDAAAAACDDLVQARVLRGGPELRFVHPLIGGVVYADIPVVRRASLHERAARLLAEDGADPGLVAAHLLRCEPAGDRWVVEQLCASAERELERGSPSTAVTLMRRVVAEPPPADEKAGVLLMLGRAEAKCGDPAARGTLRDALNAADAELERGRIAVHLGRLLLRAGDPTTAAAVVREAAEAVEWREPELRLQLEALLVNIARSRAELIPLIPERLALVHDRASDATFGGRLIAAQLSWGMVAICGPAVRAVKLARRALAGGASLADAASSPDEFIGAIHMLTFCDELDEADELLARIIDDSQRSGSEPGFAGASCFRSYNALLRGELGLAELLARDAVRTSTGGEDLTLMHELASAFLVLALVERGNFDEAAAIAPNDPLALERAEVSWATEMLFAAGRLALRSGRAREAVDALGVCGRRAERWGVANPAWLPWRSETALALHAVGDSAKGMALCEEELELAHRFGARRPIGIALRARGLLGGGAAGIDALRESAAVLAASPARLERAHTMVELGSALRRGNRRAEAREPLSEGMSLASQLGAAPLADRARSELVAAGARPRSVIRAGSDALTASERRVCELAAAGNSNPEIAQMLFVTRATIESHLHSAYRRLGISARSELAAALGSQP